LQVIENAIQQKIKDINACNSLEELDKYPAPTDVPEDGRIYVARVARKNAIIEAGRIASGVKPSVEVEKERIKETNELKQAQQQVVTPQPAPTVSGVRTTTHAVVVDINLIPRAYMVADLKAIEAALKNGAIVPGAKLEEKKTLAVR
jgi:hypothetical protein